MANGEAHHMVEITCTLVIQLLCLDIILRDRGYSLRELHEYTEQVDAFPRLNNDRVTIIPPKRKAPLLDDVFKYRGGPRPCIDCKSVLEKPARTCLLLPSCRVKLSAESWETDWRFSETNVEASKSSRSVILHNSRRTPVILDPGVHRYRKLVM